MASLYKKRGFYYVDFWIGEKRKSINTQITAISRNLQSAETVKTEIEKNLEMKKAEFRNQSYEKSVSSLQENIANRLNLSKLIEKYKIKLSIRSKSHQDLFKNVINMFLEIVPGDTNLSDITPEHIVTFIKYHQDKVQNATLRTYLNYLKGFFNYLVEEDFITKSPIRSRDLPRKLKKNIVTFDEEMVNQILYTAKEIDYIFYCILNLLGLTAIRPCDLLRIKLKDIDFKNKELTVKMSKTKKEIKFPIYEELLKFFINEMSNLEKIEIPELVSKKSIEYRNGLTQIDLAKIDKDKVIFEGYKVSRVGRKFRRIKKQLNITDQYKYTLKTFRKTFATLYAKKLNIQDIAYLLGHDETKTTMAFYADVIVENLRHKIDGNS